MRVVFFGTPSFALPSLESMLGSRHKVCLVVSQPDKPAGRGMELCSPPVAKRARDVGFPVVQPEKLRDPTFLKVFEEQQPDVCAVVAYGKFIPSVLLTMPRFGFVNVHPSLLPKYRGPSPIQWAILSGDRQTGVSTMLITKEMDAGPILLQEKVAIEDEERADKLSKRLARISASLLVETLNRLEDGALLPVEQDHAKATYTEKVTREMGRVDWREAAEEILRKFRAFHPWPGLWTELKGYRVKVLEVRRWDGEEEAVGEPGEVVRVGEGGIVVACGNGCLVLMRLQREGRKPLEGELFARGERLNPGDRFAC